MELGLKVGSNCSGAYYCSCIVSLMSLFKENEILKYNKSLGYGGGRKYQKVTIRNFYITIWLRVNANLPS